MKKAILALALTTIILAGPAQAAEPVKIGMITTLSTKAGYLGEEVRDAFKLAVVRTLMTNPKLLIMDEATEGLAPLVRKEIWRGLAVIKGYGQSILIIDKNLDELMKIADRHYIMEKGRVVWSVNTAEISTNDQLKARYLGV